MSAETVHQYNVGRWCLSEDDCIAQGINFAAYERGVSDAAEAFSRNAAEVQRLRKALRDVLDWLDDGNRQLSDACQADVNRARAALNEPQAGSKP